MEIATEVLREAMLFLQRLPGNAAPSAGVSRPLWLVSHDEGSGAIVVTRETERAWGQYRISGASTAGESYCLPPVVSEMLQQVSSALVQIVPGDDHRYVLRHGDGSVCRFSAPDESKWPSALRGDDVTFGFSLVLPPDDWNGISEACRVPIRDRYDISTQMVFVHSGDGGSAWVDAADGYHGCRVTLTPMQKYMPAGEHMAFLSDVVMGLSTEIPVWVWKSESHVRISSGPWTVVMPIDTYARPLPLGRFLDGKCQHVVWADAREMMDVVLRMRVVAKDDAGRLRLVLSPGRIHLSATTADHAKASAHGADEVSVEYDGPDAVYYMRDKFLLQYIGILNRSGVEKIGMGIPVTATDPWQFFGAHRIQYIAMGMREAGE